MQIFLSIDHIPVFGFLEDEAITGVGSLFYTLHSDQLLSNMPCQVLINLPTSFASPASIARCFYAKVY